MSNGVIYDFVGYDTVETHRYVQKKGKYSESKIISSILEALSFETFLQGIIIRRVIFLISAKYVHSLIMFINHATSYCIMLTSVN